MKYRNLPPVIDSAFVASAFDWDVQRARRWLKSTDIGEKRGGRWVTTPEKLRRDHPDLLEQILRLAEDDEDEDEQICAACLKQGARLRASQDETRTVRNDLAITRSELEALRRSITGR